MANTQEKLSRVRKPRVHITYDVETEGASVEQELPYVLGVMGEYSGNNPTKEKKKYNERKFVQLDRDNFNEIMTNIGPGLSLKVDNTLKDDDSQISVDLAFNTLDDFEPEKIVEQVPALKSLLETRNQLRDLLSKADRSEDLENILEQVLQSSEDLQQLSEKLGVEAGETDNSGDDKPEGDK